MSSSHTTPKWVLRLTNPSKATPKSTSIPNPPGYAAIPSNKSRDKSNKNVDKSATAAPVTKPPTPEETDALKVKKAWELALGPAKQLPMNAIGMYMTGNGLQIFSIMMVFMLFKGPITAILGLSSAFERFETQGNRDKMLLVKAAYVVTNLMLLALGIYKVNAMGLLPTTRSDWLLWETARTPLERAYFVQ